jgi:hypothetical protein
MNGSPIWASAATRYVDCLQDGHLLPSHGIDPNVDAEREFIAQNLRETHLVTKEKYYSSAVPVFQAQTASGETYHSDSRMLLLDFSQRPTPTLAAIQAAAQDLGDSLLSSSQ